MPPSLQGTLLHQVPRIHELEHVIQTFVLIEAYPKRKLLHREFLANFVELRLEEEKQERLFKNGIGILLLGLSGFCIKSKLEENCLQYIKEGTIQDKPKWIQNACNLWR